MQTDLLKFIAQVVPLKKTNDIKTASESNRFFLILYALIIPLFARNRDKIGKNNHVRIEETQ